MAISSSTRKAGPFIGNDATTVFPFAFKVFTSADLRVVRTNALGVESDLVLDTDYTVALNANQDNDPGGTVTRATALPTGERLTITSDVEALQPLVLTNNGGFYPRVINDAFDKITIIAQQLIEQVGRSLKLPISSTASATLPDPVANRLIAWNSSANGFTNVDPASLATVAAYADANLELFTGNGTQTAFTLAEDPAVLANLDVSISGVTQVGGEDFTWIGTTLTFVVAPPTGTRIQVRYTRAIPPVDLAAAVAAAEADRVATAADRVATAADRVATAADRVQTGLDVIAAEADRVATAADRVQTGLDRVATAADRVQTGLDVVATGDKVSLTALAASTGAALVGGIQSGTGAVAETVQTTGRRVVYADQYSTPQQAITAAGSNSTVVFKPGATTTLISPLSLSGLSNVRLVGYGHNMTCGATRINGFIDASNATNVIIEGFVFDSKQPSMPVYTQADYAVNTYYNSPVVLNGGWTNITVRDCVFNNLYTSGVWAYNGVGVSVTNCYFYAPVCNQTNSGTPAAQQYTFVYLQTFSGNNLVKGCAFYGSATTNPALPPSAVFVSGLSSGNIYIKDNFSTYCSRDNTGGHRLGVFDVYGDATHYYVIDNVCINLLGQFGRVSATNHAVVKNNYVQMSANCEVDYSIFTIESTVAFSPGQVGCQDITFEGNTLIDTDRRTGYSVGVLSYDWGAPATDIYVRKNTFLGGKLDVLVEGPFYNVQIDDNENRQSRGCVTVRPGSGITSVIGVEANSTYDRLFIRRNAAFNTINASAANGIAVSLGTATTAYVGLAVVEDNDIRGTLNGGQGITVQQFSSTRANSNARVQNNVVQGYNNSYYIRDGGECLFQNNRSKNAATAPLLYSPGDMLYFNANGNRYGVSGALVGTATLVAGTVTVSTDEVRTGDRIRVTRTTAGGVIGVSLVIGTITNATSFVINAVDAAGSVLATDTSTVLWEIIH